MRSSARLFLLTLLSLAACRAQLGTALPEKGRTPALVTCSDGSLFAVCETPSSGLAASVSADGGKHRNTTYPEALRGLSYPCLLTSGEELWLLALDGKRPAGEIPWNPSGISGAFLPELRLLHSSDGGVSWISEGAPTLQVELKEGDRLAPGPGRGISMADGTLIFPVQRIDPAAGRPGIPSYQEGVHTAGDASAAGVMVSEDGGATWQIHGWAKSGTTESQVVESSPGVLMLSMRDNAPTGRAVYVSTDKGQVWHRYVADGMLSDSGCQASLLALPAAENVFDHDLLLFCNPDDEIGRSRLTLRMSVDGGYSYPFERRIREEESHGYCCLSQIDSATVGVLYEAPGGGLAFQAVALQELYPGPVFRHLPVPVIPGRPDVPLGELQAAPWDSVPAFSLRIPELPDSAIADCHYERGRVFLTLSDASVPAELLSFTAELEGPGLTVIGDPRHRLARKVRDKGDDGVFLYRIPALVRTHAGTLVACYDIRWKKGHDMPNDIDVGVSRSTDNGHTWEPMQVAMDMGTWGGWPPAFNGIGDPCLLLDEGTGDLLLFGGWCHIGSSWTEIKNGKESVTHPYTGTGFEPENAGQLMLSRSSDDGLTWSEPVNITRQVKDSTWRNVLDGPGIGITMADGTLAVPLQFRNADNIPSATIIYSKDHGTTWQRGQGHIKLHVNEAQIAEIEPGVLMINARDRSISGRRAVYTTRDLGDHWTKHPTDSTLVECFCQASLYKVDAKDNCLGKDLLFFCNCAHNPRHRRWMTVRLSLDKGMTWPCSLLLDWYHGMGYSCMTLLDPETLGILYESSQGDEIFQKIPIRELYETGFPSK